MIIRREFTNLHEESRCDKFSIGKQRIRVKSKFSTPNIINYRLPTLKK